MTFQPSDMRSNTTSISLKSQSIEQFSWKMVYLVAEPSFVLIISIREKGTNPCPGPAEHIDDKRNLHLVAWVNKARIILSPKCSMKLDQFVYAKQVLWFSCVYDKAFLG